MERKPEEEFGRRLGTLPILFQSVQPSPTRQGGCRAEHFLCLGSAEPAQFGLLPPDAEENPVALAEFAGPAR